MADFWENWARGESPKIVADFWENWARGESTKIVANSARQIQETHIETQLKDLPSDSRPGGNRTPDRPWPTVLHLRSGTLIGEKRNFPKKASLFWENQNWISQTSSKFSTSEQGVQEAQT